MSDLTSDWIPLPESVRKKMIIPIIHATPRLPSDATLPQSIIRPAPPNLSPEATYRYHERLGILCGTAEPTPQQHLIALLEAREYDLNNE